MSIPFYAKSEHNQGYIKNLEVVGFSDLNGVNAFQMALYKTGEKYYMYCGSFKGAGVNILDVTDPEKPEVVGCVYVSDPKVYFAQSTPKVQVADGLLIVALGGGVPFLHGIKAGDPALGGLDRLYRLKKSAYEDYRDGLIGKKDFLRYKADYEAQEEQLTAQLALLDQEPEDDPLDRPWIASLLRHGKLTELDRTTLAETVKEILVFEDGHIEITYRFADDLALFQGAETE